MQYFKRLIAPLIALVAVVTGISLVHSNYDVLAKGSEADVAYFTKHVPEAGVVLVEPNYGEFYHPDPDITGDS